PWLVAPTQGDDSPCKHRRRIPMASRGAPAKLSAAAYFAAIERYVLDNLERGQTRVHLKFLDTTPHPFLVPQAALNIASDRDTLKQHLQTWATRLGFGHEPRFESLRSGRWQTFALHERLAFETFPLDSWGNTHTEAILPAQFGYCNGAREQAGILCDGTVVPCCKDYEGVLPLGHISEQPLREILAAESACQMRQHFDRWQIPNPVCQRCMGADTQAKRFLRQVGSIAYFQVYSPLRRHFDPAWGEV
ncbi:MAG: radical SAM/SPASM domain-containing protein, partial [Synechococcaceae cyanobacterium SM2_3_60]|nr:radical SAM/SPASM domain-containing protein [Synechococcaceae cyanobacterium SM2_3_60]